MAIPIDLLDGVGRTPQGPPTNGPAYRPRLYGILLGMIAVASAGYYGYSARIHEDRVSPIYEDKLPANVRSFLESHSLEIEQLYGNKPDSISLGQWEFFRGGASKNTYEHPDLPEMVIKVPNDKGKISEDDIKLHYTNLERIRTIAAPLDHIVVPKSYFYLTSKGPMLVEERLKMESFNYGSVSWFDMQTVEKKVMDQFYAFTKAARLCDLHPENNHNAGLISQSDPQKIGIIDFDCVLAPGNTKIGALVLSAGIVLLGGAAALAKKISKVSPGGVFLLGFVGAEGTVLFLLIPGVIEQRESAMLVAGIAMAAIAAGVTTTQLAAAKVYSQVIGANA